MTNHESTASDRTPQLQTSPAERDRRNRRVRLTVQGVCLLAAVVFLSMRTGGWGTGLRIIVLPPVALILALDLHAWLQARRFGL